MSDGHPLALAPFASLVPREKWDELTRSPRVFSAGQALLRQGESGTHVLALRSGLVKVVRTDRDGRQRLLAFRGGGEILGEMALQSTGARMASVWAMATCRAAIVTAADFRRFVDSHALAYPLAVMASSRLLEQTEIHDGAVHERLGAALLRLIEVSRENGPFDLTRDDLAQHIGVGRRAVSKALAHLGQDVVTVGKGRIEVTDAARLRAAIGVPEAECGPPHRPSGPAARSVPAPPVKLGARATARTSAPAPSPRGRVGPTEE